MYLFVDEKTTIEDLANALGIPQSDRAVFISKPSKTILILFKFKGNVNSNLEQEEEEVEHGRPKT